MRLILCAAFMISMAGWNPPASAAERLGLGMVLGEPTGVSAQLKLNASRVLNSAIAYSVNDWVQFNLDYIFKKPHFFRDILRRETRLVGTIGWGALLAMRTRRESETVGKSVIGLRLPCGGEYPLRHVPLTFFFEIVPGIQVVDRTDILLQAGVGARYFF